MSWLILVGAGCTCFITSMLFHPFCILQSTWCGLEHWRMARRSCEWLWRGVRSTRSETFGRQPQALSATTDKVPWQKCFFVHRFVILCKTHIISPGSIFSPSDRIWREIVQTAGFLNVISRYWNSICLDFTCTLYTVHPKFRKNTPGYANVFLSLTWKVSELPIVNVLGMSCIYTFWWYM